MKRIALLLIILTASLAATAQIIPVNPKFGEVSDLEIDLKVYEPDTSAVALMLYREYTMDLVFNSLGQIEKMITVHERIKVLKEEGKKYGDYSFLYVSDNKTKEYYSGVKVETFNREEGKVVRKKMSGKYDFDEKYAEGVRRRSFSAENVKVGSVIEVAYTFSSPRYYAIDNLYIQLTIPVNRTHIEAGFAEYFSVRRTQRGSVPVQFSNSERSGLVGSYSYRIIVDNFDAEDIPALPVESHSFCPEQYRAAIMYDLAGVIFPGSSYQSISMTWDDVDKAIAESDIFSVCKGRFRDSKELEAALEGIEDDEERIIAIRNYVAGKVKWNEKCNLVPESARDILKQGSGSDADINALTASALNTLGYTAEPVMIRLLTSGTLLDSHISLRSFDTFILRVSSRDGSRFWYLDAAREEGYLNVLDLDFLVEKARHIPYKGSGEWVDLTKLTAGSLTEYVTAKIDKDGNLTGNSKITCVNEDSYDIKSLYKECETEEVFLEQLESSWGIDFTRFEINREYGPKAELNYDFEKDQDAGERIYIRPVLHPFHPDTYFREEERKLPVDFHYPDNVQYAFMLEIPEGYEIEELPKTVSKICPPVNGRIQFQAQRVGNMISVIYRYTMNKTVVLPEEYSNLRLFWETAVSIEKSTIVLKKQ